MAVETKTEVKTPGYMVDGELRRPQSDTWVDIPLIPAPAR